MTEDPLHWPVLRNELQKMVEVATIPGAKRLRSALLSRFANGDIETSDANELLSVSVEANDTQTALALAQKGVQLTLRKDKDGKTVLHHVATTGDEDRYRSVLAIGSLVLPLDNWGRRPSDLAAEANVEIFRTLEADLEKTADQNVSQVLTEQIVGQPPFLSLERDSEARCATTVELATLRQLWQDDWGDSSTLDFNAYDLAFHTEVALIEARPRSSENSSGRLCFLLQNNAVHRLAGTSLPIHEVNAKGAPLLNEHTVLDYLNFFCFFVRGEEGPFLIVDRLENQFLPDFEEPDIDLPSIFRPPRVWGKDEQECWRVSALVYYANAVVAADFSVQPGGMIEMVNDIPVLADLPARIDAPLEIRLLH